MRVIRVEVPDWHADAACRNQGHALWFPADGKSTQAARKVCADCPARIPCLDTALADPTLEGIWGGTSESDRERMRER